MGRASSEIFVGRDDELAVVEACAQDAEQGRPWVVVVEGPAGVGKSAFARRALAGLAGFVVLEAAADESAAEEAMWLAGQLTGHTAATSPFTVGMELLSGCSPTGSRRGRPRCWSLGNVYAKLHINSRRQLKSLAGVG